MTESILQIAKVNISDGYHLTVNIKVNGKSARMILDTAASRTMFDTKRIKSLVRDAVITNNLAPASTASGEVEQSLMDIKYIQLDKLVINDYKATILDLSNINNMYKQYKHQPIDGILGADILIENNACIDLLVMELIF
jgi:predicted aspartyl protease